MVIDLTLFNDCNFFVGFFTVKRYHIARCVLKRDALVRNRKTSKSSTDPATPPVHTLWKHTFCKCMSTSTNQKRDNQICV